MAFLFKSKSPSANPQSSPDTSTPQQSSQPPAQTDSSTNSSSSQSPPTASQSTQTTPQPEPETFFQSLTTRRARKQLSLFFLGASFLAFSSILTRRQLLHRYRMSTPLFFRPSNLPPEHPVNAPLEAIQALNIATLNVASSVFMLTGGLFWAFDISSVDDLRRRIRGGLGVDGTGRGVREVEEEFEEWLAETLKRRKEKEQKRGERERETEVVEEEVRRNERGKRR